jgi:hypothetical protein
VETTYCQVADCEQPTEEGRVRCGMHEKRFRRGRDLHAPRAEDLTPKQRFKDSAVNLANSNTDDDYDRHDRAHDLAAKAWLRRRRSALPRTTGRRAEGEKHMAAVPSDNKVALKRLLDQARGRADRAVEGLKQGQQWVADREAEAKRARDLHLEDKAAHEAILEEIRTLEALIKQS